MKAGGFYFMLVFGAGFVLGVIRTVAVTPLAGERAAVLLELPLMLVLSLVAARGVVRRWAVPATAGARLAMGMVALGLMLAAEFGLVLWLRGVAFSDYLAGRDPVSSAAYYFSLVVFGLMPVLLLAENGERGR